MDTKKNIYWVDSVKAICMIAVFVLHTEEYYGKGEISYGYWLTPFYVNAFFFISGYLFFRKYLRNNHSQIIYSYDTFKKHIYKLFAALIWPTLVFSSILFVPKILFHAKEMALTQYVYNVFGGVSFWFTSALVVSQLLLAVLLLTQIKNIYTFVFLSILFFIAAYILKDIDNTPFPWYYRSGMGATLFMTLGGVFMRYEDKISKTLMSILFSTSIVIYIIIMYADMNSLNAHYAIMSMNFNAFGMVKSILGIIIIIGIAKILPENRFLTYIGKNSIFYYFLSGALPAALGLVVKNLIGLQWGYFGNILVISLSVIMSSFLFYIINRYFSYLLDFRKLPFLNNEK